MQKKKYNKIDRQWIFCLFVETLHDNHNLTIRYYGDASGEGSLKRLFFAVSESLCRVLSENEWMIHKHVRIRKIRTIDRGRLIAWNARSCQLQYACCKHCARSVCFEMAACFFFKFKRTLKWDFFLFWWFLSKIWKAAN